jgi:hypothetical protein
VLWFLHKIVVIAFQQFEVNVFLSFLNLFCVQQSGKLFLIFQHLVTELLEFLTIFTHSRLLVFTGTQFQEEHHWGNSGNTQVV